MRQKASYILQQKEYTASKKDREKIHAVYQQLSRWLNNFKKFGEAEYKLMLRHFMDKIDSMVIDDATIVTYLKNSVQTKLKEKKKKDEEH